jgi:hypothetical protein
VAERSSVWRSVGQRRRFSRCPGEADIEHPVGLVEDGDADIVENQQFPADEIEDPTGVPITICAC